VLVQPVVRRKAESLGSPGLAWLRDLQDLVRELERRWSVRVERSLDGGTAAYVGLVRDGAGRPAVLKVSVPDPDFGDEIGTLAHAGGRGYVHLLASDPSSRAMLLERLGPSLPRTPGMSPASQIDVMCRLLAGAWAVPPPPGAPSAPRDKARELGVLVRQLWDDLGRPCPTAVVDRALDYSARRSAAFDRRRCVWVHGDAAPANALQVLAPRPGAEAGFVLVDPDGFAADPAYDIGVVLRDWCAELIASDHPEQLARHYCELLATGSGHDEQAIWEWGYLERVSTGLYALAMGADDLAAPFLRTAELLR
jgi:streptomycin 6-kinase